MASPSITVRTVDGPDLTLTREPGTSRVADWRDSITWQDGAGTRTLNLDGVPPAAFGHLLAAAADVDIMITAVDRETCTVHVRSWAGTGWLSLGTGPGGVIVQLDAPGLRRMAEALLAHPDSWDAVDRFWSNPEAV